MKTKRMKRTLISHAFSNKHVLMAWLITILIFSSSDAFMIHTNTDCTFTTAIVGLYAKNTNKNKKRIGGPRGGGGRGKSKKGVDLEDDDDKIAEVSIPEPSKIRKINHQFDRPELKSTLRVCTAEIDDVKWWENPDNENPYGGKIWPSSLAISEFLVSLGNLEGYDILELGCGVGLVSIVAGQSGARVVASDISPTIIKLCKIGWLETQKLRQKQTQSRQQNNKMEEDDDDRLHGINVTKVGSLNTFVLDLFSERKLPMSASSSNQKLVIAAAMVYDAGLAAVLAQRAFEACSRDAWFILGDDDTGEREGGRQLFISEFNKLEKQKGIQFQRTWTRSVVKSKSLQWSEKQVKVLHLNVPKGVILTHNYQALQDSWLERKCEAKTNTKPTIEQHEGKRSWNK